LLSKSDRERAKGPRAKALNIEASEHEGPSLWEKMRAVFR
jgi:hypothetical protein